MSSKPKRSAPAAVPKKKASPPRLPWKHATESQLDDVATWLKERASELRPDTAALQEEFGYDFVALLRGLEEHLRRRATAKRRAGEDAPTPIGTRRARRRSS